MSRRCQVLLLLCFLCLSARSQPLVVDFENYQVTHVYDTVSSQGFVFKAASGPLGVSAAGSDCLPQCASDGTTALFAGGVNTPVATVAPVTMSRPDGAGFVLDGLDFAELFQSASQDTSAATLLLTGLLQGGGTVSQSLSLDGLNDGPGGADDFQAAVLGKPWSGSPLAALQFSGFSASGAPNRAFQLDNIAVFVTRSPVPESASASLLALGLGWLGLMFGKPATMSRIRRP